LLRHLEICYAELTFGKLDVKNDRNKQTMHILVFTQAKAQVIISFYYLSFR
jgi:hypothetical protein